MKKPKPRRKSGPIECEFTFFGQRFLCRRRGTGGTFNTDKRIVDIDTRFDWNLFRNYLHHELLEGALFFAGRCYGRQYPDDQEIYVFDHATMDVISGQVRAAYEEVIQKMAVLLEDRQ